MNTNRRGNPLGSALGSRRQLDLGLLLANTSGKTLLLLLRVPRKGNNESPKVSWVFYSSLVSLHPDLAFGEKPHAKSARDSWGRGGCAGSWQPSLNTGWFFFFSFHISHVLPTSSVSPAGWQGFDLGAFVGILRQ